MRMIRKLLREDIRERKARPESGLRRSGAAAVAAAVCFSLAPGLDHHLQAQAQTQTQILTPHQQLAVQIYRELVEINTVSETGDTGRAADAMATRLRIAGFGGSDL